jgi:transposase-like protein
MKRTVTKINEAAKIRLAAIEMYQGGRVTMKEVAEKFGVHETTISEWIRMYEEGGIDRLKIYMKPRPKHVLDIAELRARLEKGEDHRIRALLDLAQSGGKLNKTAAAHGVTPQGLAKWRRQYITGKI